MQHARVPASWAMLIAIGRDRRAVHGLVHADQDEDTDGGRSRVRLHRSRAWPWMEEVPSVCRLRVGSAWADRMHRPIRIRAQTATTSAWRAWRRCDLDVGIRMDRCRMGVEGPPSIRRLSSFAKDRIVRAIWTCQPDASAPVTPPQSVPTPTCAHPRRERSLGAAVMPVCDLPWWRRPRAGQPVADRDGRDIDPPMPRLHLAGSIFGARPCPLYGVTWVHTASERRAT